MGGETQTRIKGTSFPKLSAGPVGAQVHSIYKDRLGQFTGNGQFESQGLLSYVFLIYLQPQEPVPNQEIY